MRYDANTPDEYVDKLPERWKSAFIQLRESIRSRLPDGYIECMQYGMISYVVSPAIFPEGYHVDGQLLPYISIAAQKNYISLYHMALYADKKLMDWFVSEWDRCCDYRLDMGKSCIRFKNPAKIPYELISELVSRLQAKDWVELYKKYRKS